MLQRRIFEPLGLLQTDILGSHNFEVVAAFEDAVLVDARTVRERVRPDDGFVGGDADVHQPGNEAARVDDLFWVDITGDAEIVAPGEDGHHDLFERRIARAFAQTVDRALRLTGSALQGGQGIGDGHPQVVVTVHADDRVIDVPHVGDDIRDELSELVRDGVSDGVRNVDRRSAGGDGGFNHLVQIIRLGTDRIHRGELDVLALSPGKLDGIDGHFEDFLRRFSHHGTMLGRTADERMQPRLRGAGQSFSGTFDVEPDRAGQTADPGAFDLVRDAFNRLEVFVRRNGETGLDDVDVQTRQLMGNFEFFTRRQRASGRLFGVPQRGVENDDLVFGVLIHGSATPDFGS